MSISPTIVSGCWPKNSHAGDEGDLVFNFNFKVCVSQGWLESSELERRSRGCSIEVAKVLAEETQLVASWQGSEIRRPTLPSLPFPFLRISMEILEQNLSARWASATVNLCRCWTHDND